MGNLNCNEILEEFREEIKLRRMDETSQKLKLLAKKFDTCRDEARAKTKKNPQQENDLLCEKRRLDSNDHYNVRFVKHVKPGQSSLINAICDFDKKRLEDDTAKQRSEWKAYKVDKSAQELSNYLHLRYSVIQLDDSSRYSEENLLGFNRPIISVYNAPTRNDLEFDKTALLSGIPIDFFQPDSSEQNSSDNEAMIHEKVTISEKDRASLFANLDPNIRFIYSRWYGNVQENLVPRVLLQAILSQTLLPTIEKPKESRNKTRSGDRNANFNPFKLNNDLEWFKDRIKNLTTNEKTLNQPQIYVQFSNKISDKNAIKSRYKNDKPNFLNPKKEKLPKNNISRVNFILKLIQAITYSATFYTYMFNCTMFSLIFQKAMAYPSQQSSQYTSSLQHIPFEPSHCSTDKECETCNEHNECTSCNDFYITLKKADGENIVKCLDGCSKLQYGDFVLDRTECHNCDVACSYGCLGPFKNISSQGCKKCHYGVEVLGQKICLNPGHPVCSPGYFLDRANSQELNWTDYICRECHPECSSCTSNGTHPVHNKCSCNNYYVVDQKINKKDCAETCPIGFMDIPILNQTNYTLCILCDNDYVLDPMSNICIPDKGSKLIWYVIIAAATSLIFVFLFCFGLYQSCFCFAKQKPEAWKRTSSTLCDYFPCFDVICHCIENRIKKMEQQGRDLTHRCWSSRVSNKSQEAETEALVAHEKLFIPEEALAYEANDKNRLDQGSSTPIYKGKYNTKDDYKNVAIKVLERSKINPKEIIDQALVRAKLEHRNVHQFVAIGATTDKLKLVFPRRLGNLRDYMLKNKMRWFRDYDFCVQIASGMSYLTEKGIIHGNLMATKILVTNPDRVEISGFGFPKNKHEESWRWMSMECLDEQKATHESDLWSYGVTCWEIFSYEEPDQAKKQDLKPYDKIHDKTGLKNFLESGQRLDKPGTCEQTTFSEIQAVWNLNPKERPNFKHFEEYFSVTLERLRRGDKDVFECAANLAKIQKISPVYINFN